MTKQSLDSLSMAIMNIPCKRDDNSFRDVESRLLYKEGHRDARHAAVELLLNFIAQNDVLQNSERYVFLRHADLEDLQRRYYPNSDVPEGAEFDKIIDSAIKSQGE